MAEQAVQDLELVFIREELADHPLMTPVDDTIIMCVLLLRLVGNDGY